MPSEWPECLADYSKDDLKAYAAQVKKVGLADARAPVVCVLPEEAEPIKRLKTEDVKPDPVVVTGTSRCGHTTFLEMVLTHHLNFVVAYFACSPLFFLSGNCFDDTSSLCGCQKGRGGLG